MDSKEGVYINRCILNRCYNGSKTQEHQVEKYLAEQAMDGKVVYFPEQFSWHKHSVWEQG